jgi:hypothetical protein
MDVFACSWMMTSVEQLVESLAGENEVLGENVPH